MILVKSAAVADLGSARFQRACSGILPEHSHAERKEKAPRQEARGKEATGRMPGAARKMRALPETI
jgi:hypothetical protein